MSRLGCNSSKQQNVSGPSTTRDCRFWPPVAPCRWNFAHPCWSLVAVFQFEREKDIRGLSGWNAELWWIDCWYGGSQQGLCCLNEFWLWRSCWNFLWWHGLWGIGGEGQTFLKCFTLLSIMRKQAGWIVLADVVITEFFTGKQVWSISILPYSVGCSHSQGS